MIRSVHAWAVVEVFLETARFFDGGPDEDDGSSRSLVSPDIATAQTKICPYTSKIYPEIVRLPNVIASPVCAACNPHSAYENPLITTITANCTVSSSYGSPTNLT